MKGIWRGVLGVMVALITCLSIIGWNARSHAQTSPTSLSLDTAGLTLEQLADGVYGLIASTDFPPQDPATTAICNGGIVIGTDGVLVIDPFQNEALGNLMFETVASLTDQPVTYVVNTHYHFDHTGGNPAAQAKEVPIVGRGPIRDYMITRNAEMDPNPTPPDVVVNGATAIWLGDRQVYIEEVEGHSSGTDIIAYVPEADVLFAGDMVFHQRIPYLGDGSIRQWQASLAYLMETYPAATVLPGHGDVTNISGLEAQRAYFENLEQRALSWQAQNLSQEAAIAMSSDIPAAYQDYLFQALYPGNLDVAYQQITLNDE
ncbi:MAG: MBL fold metallo-hydrolase [Elainellaceae cyanobacterium]